jgi:hypothetical protein
MVLETDQLAKKDIGVLEGLENDKYIDEMLEGLHRRNWKRKRKYRGTKKFNRKHAYMVHIVS